MKDFRFYTQDLTKNIAWDIAQSHVYDSKGKQISDYKAITRNDTDQILNVCKKTYTPTPNTYFTDKVQEIAEFTGFTLTGYHERKQGKQVLAYLENPQPIQIADEQHGNFIVLGNSHDGSTSFFSGSGNIMFRCSNGLTVANINTFKVLHRKNAKNRIDELAQHYKNFQAQTQKVKQTIESFEKVQISEHLKLDFSKKLLEIPKELELVQVSTRKQNQYNQLEMSIERETDYFGNNLLGLFQGVTHYTSNIRQERNPNFLNVLGSNADLNRRALNLSLELLNN